MVALAPHPAEYRRVTFPSRFGIRVSSDTRVGSTPDSVWLALLRVRIRDVVVLIFNKRKLNPFVEGILVRSAPEILWLLPADFKVELTP